MAKRGWSWRAWVLPGLGALGALLAGVSGLAVSATEGGAHAWWIAGVVAGIVLGAGSSAVSAVQSGREVRRAEQVEIDTRVALNDILDPLVRLVGSVVAERSAPRRAALQKQLVQAVLASASGLIGPDRVRACWFDLQVNDHGTRNLVSTAHYGRADSPRTTFVGGTAAGDAALALVDQDVDRFCPDVDDDPPPGWTGTTPRSYRTFTSVPAVCAGVGYSTLTIDALEPGDLIANDKYILRLMAGLLADGLAR